MAARNEPENRDRPNQSSREIAHVQWFHPARWLRRCFAADASRADGFARYARSIFDAPSPPQIGEAWHDAQEACAALELAALELEKSEAVRER